MNKILPLAILLSVMTATPSEAMSLKEVGGKLVRVPKACVHLVVDAALAVADVTLMSPFALYADFKLRRYTRAADAE